MKSIQPFIHRKMVVLHDDATAEQAARVMKEQRVGSIIVADYEGHIVGILTKSDLIERIIAESEDPGAPLSEIMTPSPITIDENSELQNAIRVMQEYGIRRVPVLSTDSSGKQKCIGLVSLDDLIAHHSVEYADLMRIIRSQVLRRFRPHLARPYLRIAERSDTISERKAFDSFCAKIGHAIRPVTRLTEAEIENLSSLILGAFAQRLHFTGALHLLSQLPQPLQDALLELPPGPNHAISLARILNDLEMTFNWNKAAATQVLTLFCSTLEDWIDAREIAQVKAQLPKEFKELFKGSERTEDRKKSA